MKNYMHRSYLDSQFGSFIFNTYESNDNVFEYSEVVLNNKTLLVIFTEKLEQFKSEILLLFQSFVNWEIDQDLLLVFYNNKPLWSIRKNDLHSFKKHFSSLVNKYMV